MQRILRVLRVVGEGGRGGASVEKSWQCELWLNRGRECTERLETVGVKKTPSSFFHPSYNNRQWSGFHALPVTNNLFRTFVFLGGGSHRVRPFQTADEKHVVFYKGLEPAKIEPLFKTLMSRRPSVPLWCVDPLIRQPLECTLIFNPEG